MGIDRRLIAPQIERLYRGKLLHEITTGHSGDGIFALEAAPGQCILRVSEFSEKKQAHTEFETRWTAYLSDRIGGVVKPGALRQQNVFLINKGWQLRIHPFFEIKSAG